MSTLGTKGEKNQGKYKAIDINNLYKGTSVTPQKPATVNNRQHGLQSLGKVANLRRMPPPANLPSLKSEGIVEIQSSTPPNSSGWTKEDSASEDATSPGAIQQQNSSQYLSTSSPSLDQAQEGVPVGVSTTATGGPVLWSNVTSGARRPGGFLNQKSAIFHEEFPQLASGNEDRTMMPRREDENIEQPRGPGLNLRPQNVGSWKEGGGRPKMPLEETALPQGTPSPQGLIGEADVGADTEGGVKPVSNIQAPMPFHGPVPPMMPMRPMMQPPPHLGQIPMMPAAFRQMMMPPFGFRPGFPPNYPPNFMQPGMPRAPFMNPAEFPFQGMYGMAGWNYPRAVGPPVSGSNGGEEHSSERPAIVKDKDLEEFDKLAISDDGWARSNVDVDYSERLVFSDEEEPAASERSDKAPAERQINDTGSRDPRDRHSDCERDGSSKRQPKEEQGVQRQNSLDRPAMLLQRPGWPKWQEAPYDYRVQPMPLGQPPQLMQQRPQLVVPADSHQQHNSDVNEPDEEEVWRHRRKLQSESMSAAIERARQRREEEERRMKEEQTAAAREKLRQLDEKLGRKDDKDNAAERTKSHSDVKDDTRKHDPSGDSEKADLNPINTGVARNHSQQQYSSSARSDSGHMPADMLDVAVRPPMSTSPSPPRPMQQIPARLPAPPRAMPSGYWPYDTRPWMGNMPVPPRFMMDPRMFMVPRNQIPGMTGNLPMRQSSADSSSEGREGNPDIEPSSARCVWPEQTPFGMYSHGPGQVGSSYDQHAARGTGQFDTYGQPVSSYENDFSDTARLLSGRHGHLRGTPDLDEQSTGSALWGDRCRHFSEEEHMESGEVHEKMSGWHRDLETITKRSAEPESKDSMGSDRPVASCVLPNRILRHNDRENDLKDDDLVHRRNNEHFGAVGQEYKRKDDSTASRDYKDEPRNVGLYAAAGGNVSVSTVRRTHSSASNSSAASNERRNDSPRDSKPMVERHKETAKKPLIKTTSQEQIPGSLNVKAEAVEAGITSHKDAKMSACEEVNVVPPAAVSETNSTEGTSERPTSKKSRNSSRSSYGKRRKEFGEERVKMNIGSREFVRGGRGRPRGSSRGRGRSYNNEYDDYYYDDEYEDDYFPEHSRAPAPARQNADERKKSALPLDAGRFSQGGAATENCSNKTEQAPSAPHRKETPRNQQPVQRPRDGQRNESRNNQRHDSAPNSKKEVQRSQQLGSAVSQKAEYQLPAGKNDTMFSDQQSESASSRAASDMRQSQQARNYGGRTRRGNKPPSDQPRQQQQSAASAMGKESVDPDGHKISIDKMDADVAKSKAKVAAISQETGGAAVTAEDAEDELQSNRQTGSHRRRRRPQRPPWPRHTAGSGANDAESLLDPVQPVATCSENTVASEARSNSKPTQQSVNSQPSRRQQRDDARPKDYKPNHGEGSSGQRDANVSRQRPNRDAPLKKRIDHRSQPTSMQYPGDNQTQGSGITNTAGGNEEWETASESSDVLKSSSHSRNSHQQQMPRKDRERQSTDRRDNKKSFSSQRPGQGRRGRPADQHTSGTGNDPIAQGATAGTSAHRGNPESAGNRNHPEFQSANGRGEARTVHDGGPAVQRQDVSSPGLSSSSAGGSVGTVQTVYRMDGIVFDSPHRIRQALYNACNRYGVGYQSRRVSSMTKGSSIKQCYPRADNKHSTANQATRQLSVASKSGSTTSSSRYREKTLPPRLAKLHASKQSSSSIDNWLYNHNGSGDMTPQTDNISLFSYGDHHDSGIDMHSSSCCSSPFDNCSPDPEKGGKAQLTTVFNFNEKSLKSLVITNDSIYRHAMEDLDVLTNTINRSSVRMIWQWKDSIVDGCSPTLSDHGSDIWSTPAFVGDQSSFQASPDGAERHTDVFIDDELVTDSGADVISLMERSGCETACKFGVIGSQRPCQSQLRGSEFTNAQLDLATTTSPQGICQLQTSSCFDSAKNTNNRDEIALNVSATCSASADTDIDDVDITQLNYKTDDELD